MNKRLHFSYHPTFLSIKYNQGTPEEKEIKKGM